MAQEETKNLNTYVAYDNHKLIEMLRKTEDQIKSTGDYIKYHKMFVIAYTAIIAVVSITVVNSLLFFLSKSFVLQIVALVLVVLTAIFTIIFVRSSHVLSKLDIFVISDLLKDIDESDINEKDRKNIIDLLYKNNSTYAKAVLIFTLCNDITVTVVDHSMIVNYSRFDKDETDTFEIYREERPDEEASLYVTADYLKLINVSDGTFICNVKECNNE